MANVVFTANTSWYLWNFRKSTLQALLDKGDKVYCIALKDKYTDKLVELGTTFIDTKISQYGTNPIIEAYKVLQLRRVFSKIQPDVVFSFTTKQNIYCSIALTKIQSKFMPNISGLGRIFTAGGIKKKVLSQAYKYCCYKAAHVFFQNENDCQQFIDEDLIGNTPYSRLYGSGVDTKRFNFVRPEVRFNTNKIRFVLAARLLVEKGVLYFIEAAKEIKHKYPNTEFHIIGPVLETDNYPINLELLNSLSQQGLISYHGECDNIEKKLQDMHCMVLPTYYAEGVPKTLIEGISCGLAIITTKNGGCVDTVFEGENGFLINMHDENSLIEAIEQYIQLTAKQKSQFSHAARKLAISRFDDRINISCYLRRTALALEGFI